MRSTKSAGSENPETELIEVLARMKASDPQVRELAELLVKLRRADPCLIRNLIAVGKRLLFASQAAQTGSVRLHLHEGKLQKVVNEFWEVVG